MYDNNSLHDIFQSLSDTAVVWRYMDIAKFLSMINDQALFFTRADLMADRWEGAMGPKNIEMRPEVYGESYATMQARGWLSLMQRERNWMYLNCWHANEHESAAMWSLYQSNGQGIAIQTNWQRLKESLKGNWPVHGGPVMYADYSKTFIPEENAFAPFMYKRQSFAHENEVRLILWAAEGGGPITPKSDGPSRIITSVELPPGYAVPVDLAGLTDRIYVAPDAAPWYLPLIRKIVQKYQLPWQVVQSDLAGDPIW